MDITENKSVTKLRIVLLLFIIKSVFAIAQQQKIDSIKNLINKEGNPKNTIELKTNLAESYLTVNPNLSIEIIDSLLEKVNKDKKYDLQNLKSQALMILGRISEALAINQNMLSITKEKEKINKLYGIRANIFASAYNKDSCLWYMEKRITINYKNPKELDARNLVNKGAYYSLFGEYEKAIESSFNSLKILNKVDFENKYEAKATSYMNLGRAYGYLKEYDKSLKYFLKVEDIYNEHQLLFQLFLNSVNISQAYIDLEQYENSIEYINLKLKQIKEENFDNIKGSMYHNLAQAYFKKGKNISALEALDVAIELDKVFSPNYGLMTDLSLKADILYQLKKYHKALEVYKELEEFNSINPDDLIVILRGEIMTNLALKGEDSILEKFSEYIQIKDTLHSKNILDKSLELDEKYQSAQKEAKIVEQELENEKQKSYTYLALGGIGFIMLLSGGGYAYNIQKQKQKELKKQEELGRLQQNMTKLGLSNLNNQINSHDFKNTLSAALNEVQEKAPKSYQYISNLLKITESALYSDSFTDSLKNQFTQIEGLVELSKVQLFENVDLEIKNYVDESVQIPRLLLKNLVENSIKHGIKGTKKDSDIKVEINQDSQYLKIHVKDNGRGLESKLATGKGISVYKELFNYFNQKNESKASINIENLEQGVLAEVSIPVNYKYS